VLEARGTKRNVSTVESQQSQQANVISDGVSAITDVVTVQQQGNNNNAGNAGSQFGRRRIGAINSGLRKITPTQRIASINVSNVNTHDQEIYIGALELDSHADTACVGPECRVLSVTEKFCKVNAYHPGYDAFEEIPVVQAATAYDDPETGITYILIINQALQIPGMAVTLLNPNQLRVNGIIVNDVPIHLCPNPENASHSIDIPNENLSIPLKLQGVISKVEVRLPTINEIETCKWVELTSAADWEPNSLDFVEAEQAYINANNSIQPELQRNLYSIKADATKVHDENILHQICQAVNIGAIHTKNPSHSEVLKNKVAKTFHIGLKTAEETLKATTQLAIRHTLHPIHRRYTTQVAQLRYPRLSGRHGKFHMDTFFADVPSLRGATMGQMYTNDAHFTKFYPMKTKGEAPNTLISFMQDIGIPSDLHSDNANELTQGRMRELLKEFWIKPSQSEPHSPWQVRAELAIREVKKQSEIPCSVLGHPFDCGITAPFTNVNFVT